MATLDFTALGKAIDRLGEGLEAIQREPENTLYRDAVIQRFEFTYGLSVKLLARYLEQASVEPLEADLTFPTLIRSASELGILRSGWDRWYIFRNARNLTSHTYDEAKAKSVLDKIPDFLDEARFLYRELERRNSNDAR